MAEEIWTIKAALDWTAGYLERKGDDSPLLSAQWLLSEATGLSRIELYVNYDRPLSLDERDVLRGYVTRRGRGEPLQYITGEVGFRHITVKVRQGVLIPRPETEVLVSEALSLLPEAKRPRSSEFLAELMAEDISEDGEADSEGFDCPDDFPKSVDEPSQLLVADICTGSGCIACSIAYEHPDTRVLATDIASEAILLAHENVQALGLSDRVSILRGDLGDAIPSDLMGTIDVVVSNPPYVPTAVIDQIPQEVAAFEPKLALDGGEDGLDVFRRLCDWAFGALKPGGGFACELHETCLDEAAEYARRGGYANVRIVFDLTNRPRVLTAVKPRV